MFESHSSEFHCEGSCDVMGWSLSYKSY